MGLLTSLSDSDAFLVLDASTVINLNAARCAKDILRALPIRVVVVDVVSQELEDGRQKGRNDSNGLTALVAANLVEIVTLDEVGLSHFESLVIGPASETLDDGEAATIAYATQTTGRALIDERKAIRICAGRFPSLRLGCTVDLFLHPAVQRALGSSRLADAVFNALHNARMRVLQHHVDWVVNLIGIEQAGLCSSLPNSVRTNPSKHTTGTR